MGLKYSLSITTLTIWLEVIFFIYGPDVIVEFCYKTVTVSYEVVGFLKFIQYMFFGKRPPGVSPTLAVYQPYPYRIV